MDFISGIQIGVSQGLTRTGACGGIYRRTYSTIGDAVNMAARLMQNAPLGQVLVNQNIRKATMDNFTWEELPPLLVKGKSQTVTVFRLIAGQERHGIHLHERKYAQPMKARAVERALMEQQHEVAQHGIGQI